MRPAALRCCRCGFRIGCTTSEHLPNPRVTDVVSRDLRSPLAAEPLDVAPEMPRKDKAAHPIPGALTSKIHASTSHS